MNKIPKIQSYILDRTVDNTWNEIIYGADVDARDAVIEATKLVVIDETEDATRNMTSSAITTFICV
jgi:phosphoserine aminotransferase